MESSEPDFDHDASSLIHVHDLPQLYQKPAAADLLRALDLLALKTSTFAAKEHTTQAQVAEQGVPAYLTSIVSSSLAWIEDEDTKESIWATAGARLSERSGRNAMPAMTRSFTVPDAIGHELTIQLHEPTLTEDNLGFKTWSSSLLLSRRLSELRSMVPGNINRVLEIGAGTGLVGIAAATIWKTHVVLTDLPAIVPNLEGNLALNQHSIDSNHGSVEAQALDWSDETHVPLSEQAKFTVIIAADPIYSTDHPRMLVTTVRRWISWTPQARFIIELPLRDRYDLERQYLRANLQESGFELVAEGTDAGYDDWQDQDGRPAEVTCWWCVWRPVI